MVVPPQWDNTIGRLYIALDPDRAATGELAATEAEARR
jgi:hypothetical protein